MGMCFLCRVSQSNSLHRRCFEDREVTYMASNNIRPKSVGKNIGAVKCIANTFLQKYRHWYRQYFQRMVLVSLLATLFASIVKQACTEDKVASSCRR